MPSFNVDWPLSVVTYSILQIAKLTIPAMTSSHAPFPPRLEPSCTVAECEILPKNPKFPMGYIDAILAEANKLVSSLQLLRYPSDLLRSIQSSLLPPTPWDVSTSALLAIIRWLEIDAFPVYRDFLRTSSMDILSVSDQQAVYIMYGTLRDLLHYHPRVAPEAFLDRIPGSIQQEMATVHCHRMRTVRILAKLLRQLEERWVKQSSRDMRETRGFVVLLPPSLQPQFQALVPAWMHDPRLASAEMASQQAYSVPISETASHASSRTGSVHSMRDEQQAEVISAQVPGQPCVSMPQNPYVQAAPHMQQRPVDSHDSDFMAGYSAQQQRDAFLYNYTPAADELVRITKGTVFPSRASNATLASAVPLDKLPKDVVKRLRKQFIPEGYEIVPKRASVKKGPKTLGERKDRCADEPSGSEDSASSSNSDGDRYPARKTKSTKVSRRSPSTSSESFAESREPKREKVDKRTRHVDKRPKGSARNARAGASRHASNGSSQLPPRKSSGERSVSTISSTSSSSSVEERRSQHRHGREHKLSARKASKAPKTLVETSTSPQALVRSASARSGRGSAREYDSNLLPQNPLTADIIRDIGREVAMRYSQNPSAGAPASYHYDRCVAPTYQDRSAGLSSQDHHLDYAGVPASAIASTVAASKQAQKAFTPESVSYERSAGAEIPHYPGQFGEAPPQHMDPSITPQTATFYNDRQKSSEGMLGGSMPVSTLLHSNSVSHPISLPVEDYDRDAYAQSLEPLLQPVADPALEEAIQREITRASNPPLLSNQDSVRSLTEHEKQILAEQVRQSMAVYRNQIESVHKDTVASTAASSVPASSTHPTPTYMATDVRPHYLPVEAREPLAAAGRDQALPSKEAGHISRSDVALEGQQRHIATPADLQRASIMARASQDPSHGGSAIIEPTASQVNMYPQSGPTVNRAGASNFELLQALESQTNLSTCVPICRPLMPQEQRPASITPTTASGSSESYGQNADSGAFRTSSYPAEYAHTLSEQDLRKSRMPYIRSSHTADGMPEVVISHLVDDSYLAHDNFDVGDSAGTSEAAILNAERHTALLPPKMPRENLEFRLEESQRPEDPYSLSTGASVSRNGTALPQDSLTSAIDVIQREISGVQTDLSNSNNNIASSLRSGSQGSHHRDDDLEESLRHTLGVSSDLMGTQQSGKSVRFAEKGTHLLNQPGSDRLTRSTLTSSTHLTGERSSYSSEAPYDQRGMQVPRSADISSVRSETSAAMHSDISRSQPTSTTDTRTSLLPDSSAPFIGNNPYRQLGQSQGANALSSSTDDATVTAMMQNIAKSLSRSAAVLNRLEKSTTGDSSTSSGPELHSVTDTTLEQASSASAMHTIDATSLPPPSETVLMSSTQNASQYIPSYAPSNTRAVSDSHSLGMSALARTEDGSARIPWTDDLETPSTEQSSAAPNRLKDLLEQGKRLLRDVSRASDRFDVQTTDILDYETTSSAPATGSSLKSSTQ